MRAKFSSSVTLTDRQQRRFDSLPDNDFPRMRYFFKDHNITITSM